MNSNIKPCWWGSHLWQTIYFLVAVYPDNPTVQEKEAIKNFFFTLKFLLPCEGCKKSYCKFSEEKDTSIINIDNFKNRDNLILFVYNLRQKVNDKLSHEYYITPNYFKQKLNYMLVSEKNINDGHVCNMIESPFIHKSLEKKVFNYLKNKTSYDYTYTFKFLEICKKFMENPIFDINNKHFKLINKRHKKCRKIINIIHNNMNEDNYDLITSFKTKDKKLHEKLLFLGCSVVHKDNLSVLLE